MEKKKPDFKTWWWYHRTHVLIAVLALGVAVYSFLPNLLAPKPDYGIAAVSVRGLSDERLAALRERVEELADDRSGDGRVLVTAALYYADLSGRTDGSLNYNEASRLDSDLVGRVSALLFFDDPEGFRANVAAPFTEPLPCASLPALAGLLPEGWYVAARTDCGAEELYAALTAP